MGIIVQRYIFIFLSIYTLFAKTAHAQNPPASFTVGIMGDLLIGDIQAPDSIESEAQWKIFEERAKYLATIGVDTISFDFWWGAIEIADGQFDWRYTDKLLSVMEKTGLKLVVGIATHQLGGNIGDWGYQPIPDYVWTRFIGQPGVKDEHSLKYKSEYGNHNSEVISPWGTQIALPVIRRFYQALHDHLAPYSHLIAEFNIGMGPASELRHPGYNSHDPVNYPDRGSIQAYSDLAIESFRKYIQQKYQTIEQVNRAWNQAPWKFDIKSFNEINPPDTTLLRSTFFSSQEHFSPYGQDFFDWYNQSLLDHGQILLETAFGIFSNPKSPFYNVSIGAKIPGVHWRVQSDRLAELSAGLIRTSYSDWFSAQDSYGYYDLLKMFKEVSSAHPQAPFILHFTALEMQNGHDRHMNARSKAEDLVFWMGESAYQMGLTIKGENALGPEVHNPDAWKRIHNVLEWSHYEGINFLRISEFFSGHDPVENNFALKELKHLIEAKASYPLTCKKFLK